ncbi:MAG: hypothetical protein ACI358_03485 [Candidatus Limimorpha sp.]
MTGDIFKFSENEYGILITPECDLASRKKNDKNTFEFLMIDKSKSKEFQNKKKEKHEKNPDAVNEVFNNGVISRHILASFPFDEARYNDIALINFTSAMLVIKEDDDTNPLNKRCGYKLNSPYIHQLRQRYFAFIGRYGVPKLPKSIQDLYWL